MASSPNSLKNEISKQLADLFDLPPSWLVFPIGTQNCKSCTCSGDNTEKIWVHRFFAKQRTDMPKAHKMAAGGPGSVVGFPVGVRGQTLKG